MEISIGKKTKTEEVASASSVAATVKGEESRQVRAS